MSRQDSTKKRNVHLENLTYGFATGFIVGAGISSFELAKVAMQSDKNIRLSSMLSPKFIQNNWKDFVHTAPVFATFFGGACAIEFSVNSAVSERHGANYGLCASAFSGAAFLTPAEYLMYRKTQHVGYWDSIRYFGQRKFSGAFTGFTPMVCREFLFGLSVLCTGPFLGSNFKKQITNSNNPSLDLSFHFMGIFLSALVTTSISQPFDCLARQMQIIVYKNNGEISSRFVDVARDNLNFKTLYRGFVPRLALASVGAASIGTLFRFFKEGTHLKAIKAVEEQETPTLRR